MEGETRRQDLLKQLLESAESDAANEEVLDKVVAQKLSVDLSQDDDFETRGQKAADAVAKFAGSWAFIVSFILVLIGWMCINLLLASGAFDPFPFILLNLVLSCVAAVQAPLIMMSQNRQEEKDRQRAENDYYVNLKTELIIGDLHRKIDDIIDRQEKLQRSLEELEKKENR